MSAHTPPDPPAAPTILRWSSLSADAPMPLLERRRVVGRECMVSHVTLRKGCVVPSHAHANEQMVCLLSGLVRFTLAEEADTGSAATRMVELHGGEVLYLPAFAPHGAEALEDSVVLDVFAPPSATTGIDRR